MTRVNRRGQPSGRAAGGIRPFRKEGVGRWGIYDGETRIGGMRIVGIEQFMCCLGTDPKNEWFHRGGFGAAMGTIFTALRHGRRAPT